MSGIVGQNLGRGSGLVKATAVVADSVSGASIVDDAIDSEHYAAGSIDEAHIADNAVTLAKMAGGTDGNIISFDASGDPVAIATGDDGEVLTSTGAGSPPAFEAAGGGGENTPAFSAYRSANQTLTNGVLTRVAYDLENYDVGGGFDISTNTGRWTVPSGEGGKYKFYANLRMFTGDTEITMNIQKNGSGIGWHSVHGNTSEYTSMFVVFGLPLVATDYIEIFARQNSGSNHDLHGGDRLNTSFGGFKLIE